MQCSLEAPMFPLYSFIEHLGWKPSKAKAPQFVRQLDFIAHHLAQFVHSQVEQELNIQTILGSDPYSLDLSYSFIF
jgi:hypothetical protein